MNLWKLFLLISLFVVPPAIAQEEIPAAEESGFFDSFMDVLGDVAKDALQEQVDEMAGTYKGKLDQIKLLDRRGNRIVLEVTYKDVKRSDGVTVQGQVLSGGIPLDGFSNLLTPVSGREGKVRLTISQGSQDSAWGQEDAGWDQDSGWGLEPETIALESDQIQLYLLRETHPDRPFGHIVYDLAKTWTGSDEQDVPPTAEDEGAIELAEDETTESGGKSLKPYTPVGVVLAPAKTTVSPAVITPTKTGAPIRTLSPASVSTTSYNFYKSAQTAAWRDSVHGKLTFGVKHTPTQGFIMTSATGTLSTGNSAKHILSTYPPQKESSWVEGRFRTMTLGSNVHFKAVAGFMKNSSKSDGARFRVIVDDGSRKTSVARHAIRADRYVNVDADLSAWAGKKVNIILRVDSGRTAHYDYTVWVNQGTCEAYISAVRYLNIHCSYSYLLSVS